MGEIERKIDKWKVAHFLLQRERLGGFDLDSTGNPGVGSIRLKNFWESGEGFKGLGRSRKECSADFC
jgi:hypothetical protein